MISLCLSYKELFLNGRFLSYTFIEIITIFWLWAELGNLPIIFISHYNVPVADYGYFMTFAVSIYILGTLYNQQYVSKYGVSTMLLWGIFLSVSSGLLIILVDSLMDLSPWGYQICKIPASFGIALILGNAPSLALEAARDNTGAGSALIGAFQMLAGALGIFLVSSLNSGSLMPLGIVISCCSVSALGVYGTLYLAALEPKKRRVR